METATRQHEFDQALREGDIETIGNLVQQDESLLSEPNEAGYPALIMAAYYDNEKAVEKLIDLGAPLDARDRSGNTALMGACFKGFEKTVKTLIENGADVNAQNLNGATALSYACTFNQPEIADILIKNGGDPIIKDARGNTAIDQGKMQGLKWVDTLKTD
jgi:ankyrin repeat protein